MMNYMNESWNIPMAKSMFSLEIDKEATKRGFANIKRAQSIAARNTLNTQAAMARRDYLKNVNDELIIRNTFTRRNIRFEKTEARVIKNMESKAGATEKAEYMELQEEGGIKKPKRGGSIPMAQLAARRGSLKNTVSKRRNIRSLKRRKVKGKYSKSGTSKSRTVARAYIAHKKNLSVHIDKNIYKIISFNRRNGRVRFRKIHLYNVSERRAHIKGKPMLGPAAKHAGSQGQGIYNSQVRKLLRQKKII